MPKLPPAARHTSPRGESQVLAAADLVVVVHAGERHFERWLVGVATLDRDFAVADLIDEVRRWLAARERDEEVGTALRDPPARRSSRRCHNDRGTSDVAILRLAFDEVSGQMLQCVPAAGTYRDHRRNLRIRP